MLSSNQLLIVTASTVEEVDLTASVFHSLGPNLLGIGFFPAAPSIYRTDMPHPHGADGLLPGEGLSVRLHLPLQINGGVRTAWGPSIIRYSLIPFRLSNPSTTTSGTLAPTTLTLVVCGPDSGGFIRCDRPADTAEQLGGRLLDSTGFANGLHSISEFYSRVLKWRLGTGQIPSAMPR